MKYSIIVCAYNEEKNIRSCLESLRVSLEGFGRGVEVIVVDNSSIDKTSAEISSVKSIFDNFCPLTHLVIRHVPLSISRNTGISQSKGEFVLFIDADAVVHRDWFKVLKRDIENNPQKIVFSGKVENLSLGKRDFSNTYFRMIIEPSQLMGASNLIGANMGFRKSSLEEVGAFSRVTSKRGDEVFVLRKLIEKYDSDCEYFCEESIVYNEFPNTYAQMLKLVLVESFSFASILIATKASFREVAIRLLMSLSWVAGIFLMLISPWLAMALWCMRLLLRFRFYRLSFLCSAQSSLREAVIGVFINSFNVILFDNYFWYCMLRSSFSSNMRRELPFFEKSRILSRH